jgi:hypothetical protein
VSNRSRRRPQNRPPASRPAPSQPASVPPRTPEPERLLLDQIAAGELDQHLTAIAEAVHARHELLHTVNSQKALAMLSVGDRVRINRNASPQYLHGIHGIITELDGHTALVCVHRPIGRFTSGEIRCRHSYSTDSTQPPDPSRHMSPARHANPELDALIEEITVDCHDEYEQLTGFENAFDKDANFPCHRHRRRRDSRGPIGRCRR